MEEEYDEARLREVYSVFSRNNITDLPSYESFKQMANNSPDFVKKVNRGYNNITGREVSDTDFDLYLSNVVVPFDQMEEREDVPIVERRPTIMESSSLKRTAVSSTSPAASPYEIESIGNPNTETRSGLTDYETEATPKVSISYNPKKIAKSLAYIQKGEASAENKKLAQERLISKMFDTHVESVSSDKMPRQMPKEVVPLINAVARKRAMEGKPSVMYDSEGVIIEAMRMDDFKNLSDRIDTRSRYFDRENLIKGDPSAFESLPVDAQRAPTSEMQGPQRQYAGNRGTLTERKSWDSRRLSHVMSPETHESMASSSLTQERYVAQEKKAPPMVRGQVNPTSHVELLMGSIFGGDDLDKDKQESLFNHFAKMPRDKFRDLFSEMRYYQQKGDKFLLDGSSKSQNRKFDMLFDAMQSEAYVADADLAILKNRYERMKRDNPGLAKKRKEVIGSMQMEEVAMQKLSQQIAQLKSDPSEAGEAALAESNQKMEELETSYAEKASLLRNELGATDIEKQLAIAEARVQSNVHDMVSTLTRAFPKTYKRKQAMSVRSMNSSEYSSFKKSNPELAAELEAEGVEPLSVAEDVVAEINNSVIDGALNMTIRASKTLHDFVGDMGGAGGTSNYSGSDELMDSIDEFAINYTKLPVIQKRVFQPDGKINWSKLPGTTAGALADFGMLILGAKGFGSATPMATSAASRASYGMFMSSMAQTHAQFRQAGLERGLSEAQAMDYANGLAPLISAMELIAPNHAILTPSRVAPTTIEGYMKTAAKSMGRPFKGASIFAGALAREVGKEEVQEFSQLFAERAYNHLYNDYILGNDKLETSINQAEMLETGVITFLVSGISNTPALSGLPGARNREQFAALATLSSFEKGSFEAEVARMQESGSLTESQANAVKKNVGKFREKVGSLVRQNKDEAERAMEEADIENAETPDEALDRVEQEFNRRQRESSENVGDDIEVNGANVGPSQEIVAYEEIAENPSVYFEEDSEGRMVAKNNENVVLVPIENMDQRKADKVATSFPDGSVAAPRAVIQDGSGKSYYIAERKTGGSKVDSLNWSMVPAEHTAALLSDLKKLSKLGYAAGDITYDSDSGFHIGSMSSSAKGVLDTSMIPAHARAAARGWLKRSKSESEAELKRKRKEKEAEARAREAQSRLEQQEQEQEQQEQEDQEDQGNEQEGQGNEQQEQQEQEQEQEDQGNEQEQDDNQEAEEPQAEPASKGQKKIELRQQYLNEAKARLEKAKEELEEKKASRANPQELSKAQERVDTMESLVKEYEEALSTMTELVMEGRGKARQEDGEQDSEPANKSRVKLGRNTNRQQRKGMSGPQSLTGQALFNWAKGWISSAFPGLEVVSQVDPNGPAGYIADGKLYLDPNQITPDTVMHEMAEVWIMLAEARAPELLAKAYDQIKGTPNWYKAIGAYGEYDMNGRLINEKEVAREAFAQAVAESAVSMTSDKKGPLARFWKWLGNKLGVLPRYYMDLPFATIESVTDMVAKELTSRLPITKIDGEAYTNIMRRYSKYGDISISSGILRDENTDLNSVQRGANNIAKWMRKWWSSNRGLSRSVDERIRRMENEISARMKSMTDTSTSFKKGLKAYLSDNGDPAVINNINNYLRGREELDSSLPDSLRDPVISMRAQITDMSKTMISEGMISSPLRAVFSKNMDVYLHRSYDFFDAKDVDAFISKRKRDIEKWGDAVHEMNRLLTRQNVSRVEFENLGEDQNGVVRYDVTFVNAMGIKATRRGLTMEQINNKFTNISGGKDYVVDDIRGDDSMWSDEATQEERDYEEVRLKNKGFMRKLKDSEQGDTGTFNFMAADGTPGSMAKESRSIQLLDKSILFEVGEGEAGARLEAYLRSMRSSVEGMGGLEGGRPGGKNTDILKKRKLGNDLYGKAIRGLLGEINDPVANYERTVAKMYANIANHRMLSDIVSQGEGSYFFKGKPTGKFTEVIFPESDAYHPFHQIYTTPELAAVFREYYNVPYTSKFRGAVQLLNGIAKKASTVWNISTHFRNVYGALQMFAGQGHMIDILSKGGMEGVARSFLAANSAISKRGRNYFYELAALGVASDGHFVGAIEADMDIARDGLSGKTPNDGKTFKERMARIAERLGKPIKSLDDLLMRMYQMPDDFVKIVAYENELRAIMKARGLDYNTPEDPSVPKSAKIEAAEKVKATIPTYSRVPEAMKWLNRQPLIGTFVSFTAEQIRTSFNTVKIAIDEMKGSPVMKKKGITRLASHMAMISLYPAIAAISRSIVGVSDEEDRAYRMHRAPWDRNSHVVYLSKDKQESPSYINFSYTDAFSYFTKPMYAATVSEDMGDAAQSVMFEALSPFLGEEIFVSRMVDVLANERGAMGRVLSGSPKQPDLYLSEAPIENKTYSMASHLFGALTPGTLKSGKKIYKSFTPEEEQQKEINEKKQWRVFRPHEEIISLFGTRITNMNVPQSMKFKVRDFARRISSLRQVQSRDIESWESINERKKPMFDNMQRLVQGTMRIGAMSWPEINKELKSASINSRIRRALFNGEYTGLHGTKDRVKSDDK